MSTTAGRVLRATTTVAAVIGSPVRHSLSPAILNAAFDAMALDWAFVAFDVAEGDARGALDAMSTLGLGGLSVTMPHKTAVAGALDRLSVDAARLQAVNCVARDSAGLVGHNTDGGGLLDALVADAGFVPSGARCCVVGAGGAGRAVVAALAAAGAAEVAVVNRDHGRAVAAAELAGPVGRVATGDAVAAAELVVNATSVGMTQNPGLPVDPSLLHEGQLVVDLVYEPAVTALLHAAEARGARPVGGLGMLVHQAARAVELWTGDRAPVAAMAEAAQRVLAARAGARDV